jgi:DNA polymerase-3 subunit delta
LEFEELQFELNQNRFRPVYVLVGPEEHEVRRAVHLIRTRVVPADLMAFNFSEFSGTETPWNEILGAAQTFPVMAKHRLVLVNGLDTAPSEAQRELLSYVRKPAQKTVLVLVAADLDRRTAFYRSLRDDTCMLEFAKVKGWALVRRAEEYLQHHGYRMSSASLTKVIEVAGSDLGALFHELDKLVLYSGHSKEIPDSIVDDLVQGSGQYDIFKLTGAMGRKEIRNALKILDKLLQAGQGPIYIVSMMARHFRQVLIAKELLAQRRGEREIAAAAQVNSYFMDDFMRQVRVTDRAAAERLYRHLAATDFRLKSSRIDPRVLLEELICSL